MADTNVKQGKLLMHAKAAKKAAKRQGLTNTVVRLDWLMDRGNISDMLGHPNSTQVLAQDIAHIRNFAAGELAGKKDDAPSRPEGRAARVVKAFRRLHSKWSMVERLSKDGVEANLKAMETELSS